VYVVVAVPSRDWSVYRELSSTVESIIHCSRQEAFVTQDLETALKKFKPDFISLLQNPVGLIIDYIQLCSVCVHKVKFSSVKANFHRTGNVYVHCTA